MRIYDRGIRRRLAPMMRNDRRHIELAYSLQFTMPGTPVLRYGEEIGMGENLKLPGRDSIRTPMQWDDTRNAGFSTAPPDALTRPVATRGPTAARRVNVRQQHRDKDSLMRWICELINVLRECPEIGTGMPQVLDVPLPRSVLAHRFDAPQGSILLLHNLADVPVSLDLSGIDVPSTAYQVFGDADYEPIGKNRNDLTLRGFGYCWTRLRGGAQRADKP
jgi:maltose alpha-D-glucosyltransferase/alpha-amylase